MVFDDRMTGQGQPGDDRIDGMTDGTAEGAVIVSAVPLIVVGQVINPSVQMSSLTVSADSVKVIGIVINPNISMSGVSINCSSLTAVCKVLLPTITVIQIINAEALISYYNVVNPQVVESGVVVSVEKLTAIMNVFNPSVFVGKKAILGVGKYKYGYKIRIKGMELK